MSGENLAMWIVYATAAVILAIVRGGHPRSRRP
jgi:hypothetical protein